MAEQDDPTLVADPVVDSAAEPDPVSTADPASSAAADPAPEDPASADPAAALAPPPAPKPPGDAWWQRRIDKLTAQKKELESKLAQQPDPAKPSPPAPDFREAVKAEAAALAAEERFTAQCAAVANAGKETFGEDAFNRAILSLTSTIDRTDLEEVSAYRGLIEAAISTGEAPRLIHLLGSDPNEAARIMSLPPVRMGIELAKLAMTQPDSISRAPKPAGVPRGSGGGSAPHTAIDPADPERSDRLTTTEWMARREADQNRWDARQRGGR